jgi:ribosomal protein L12E/L44/L45/RPP1/RPP2
LLHTQHEPAHHFLECTLSTANVAVVLVYAVGAEADSERVQKLLSELEGKDINEVRCSSVSYAAALLAANST